MNPCSLYIYENKWNIMKIKWNRIAPQKNACALKCFLLWLSHRNECASIFVCFHKDEVSRVMIWTKMHTNFYPFFTTLYSWWLSRYSKKNTSHTISPNRFVFVKKAKSCLLSSSRQNTTLLSLCEELLFFLCVIFVMIYLLDFFFCSVI